MHDGRDVQKRLTIASALLVRYSYSRAIFVDDQQTVFNRVLDDSDWLDKFERWVVIDLYKLSFGRARACSWESVVEVLIYYFY